MAVSQHLFQLIKSLSKAEKRHFRLSLSDGAANRNHLLLFRAIDAQSEYDETALRTKFQNRAFTAQLHVAKNYLMQVILKSLRSYHAAISKEAELRDRLHEIEILFRRDLFDLCERAITRAELKAKKAEKYQILLDILAWKRRLFLTRHGAFGGHAELAGIAEEEQDATRRIEVINQYQRTIIEKAGSATHSLARSVQLFDVPPQPFEDSLRITTLHAHLKITQQTFANDLAGAEETIDRLIDLLELNPARVADDPEPYVTVLSNKIGFALRRRDKSEILGLLTEIRAIPDRFPRRGRAPLSVRTVLRTFNIELELYRDTRDLTPGISMIEDVEHYLSSHARSIPNDYMLYFLGHRYNDSLRWINRIIAGSWGKIRDDIQSTARMLHLIIHYELGNISLLRYAVESCRRHFRKRRSLEAYERILLRLFGNLSTAPPAEHPALFEKVELQLFTTGQEKADANVLDYVDLQAWLTEKNG